MIELDLYIIKTNILSQFEEDWAKNVAQKCKQDFSEIWPSDLLFDPIPPMIKNVWDIIKTNILVKFEEY